MNPMSTEGRPASHATPAFATSDPRQQRIDARRAFVATKLVFMDATADLATSAAPLITRQVRNAKVPGDLWALLPTLLASLPCGAACTAAHAEALARRLESLAPEPDTDTSYVPL
jgi:hypothetical protein